MEIEKKPKVLVTYVEAGMGHIVSAQAICDSLKKKYGDKMEIIESYVLRDSDNPILIKYEQYLVEEVKRYSKYPAYGDMQMASMHLLGAQNTLKLIHKSVFYKQAKATVDVYKQYAPDVIVCTHYFLLHAAVEYKKLYDHKVKVVAYCPDNNIHGWWDNRADVIYTNNPLATKQAYDLRFPNGHVREVFYPTRSDVVNSNEPKEFYRKKFGIPLDKFAVVIADGVYAKAKAKKVYKELLKTDLPLTVCVLCGKNIKLKEQIDSNKHKLKPNVTLLAYGFLKDAPQLYAACDLFITKAGPNAILDSVMMGTPIITDYCATPVERATKKLFVEHMFCGYHFVNPKRIRKQVEKLILEPSLLREIKETLTFFDKSKNGADDIADDIADLIWNEEARMQKLMEEERRIVAQFMEQKASEKKARAEERIEKLNDRTSKRTQHLTERLQTPSITVRAAADPEEEQKKRVERTEEQVAKITARTEEQVAKITARTEERIEKINEKMERLTQTVDEKKGSKISAKALEQKAKPPKKCKKKATQQ